ncbi:hypothetical protein GWK47_020973 [Chionoecetes opilio]|uniref:Uncharacterized protein n=1 Tax=Chionoecetes opilio TaxID=41210 RepID=A0A8J5CH34_CHIOP|nr:hypothetical protein GWK47_020973 [Chionoecetes opilio]
MFHILETRPTKVRWCWLARERGTSTASPLVSTVLVLRVATLGGCRNPARCGTPCTCALWNTTSAATSLRCSSESRGLIGSNRAGGSGGSGWSAAFTSRRARRWMLSSLRVCEAAHDIQERAAYSKIPGLCQDENLGRREYHAGTGWAASTTPGSGPWGVCIAAYLEGVVAVSPPLPPGVSVDTQELMHRLACPDH